MLRFVVFLALFAAVVYAFFWLLERRKHGGGGGKGARPTPRGPMGPDDDEDFLRKLDWEHRRTTRHPIDPRDPGDPGEPGGSGDENTK